MIARYRLEYDDLDVYENGNLVKYEDHQREVAQLQARVAELKAALREGVSLAEADGGVTAESELWAHLLKWGCE